MYSFDKKVSVRRKSNNRYLVQSAPIKDFKYRVIWGILITKGNIPRKRNMTFGAKTVGGDNIRNRVNSALGRWSAQYKPEPPMFGAAVMDDPVTVSPEDLGGDFEHLVDMPPAAEAHGSAPVEDVPPPDEPETHEEAQNGAGPGAEAQAETAEEHQRAAGDRTGDGFTRRPDADEHKERGQAYERFEPKTPAFTDFYEILQISRNADPETIHRVYRIMAARFHPDNPRTGDPERFQLLRKAYHVLSDPGRRAEYDRSYTWVETRTMPIFELKEFVDGIDGEKNRRLGVLSLLYHRRRLSEIKPGISVLDLEQRMGLPREYLNFTLWYLKAKGFVRFEDNSDYGLTVEGVDYLEANSVQNTIIRELLEAGARVKAEPRPARRRIPTSISVVAPAVSAAGVFRVCRCDRRPDRRRYKALRQPRRQFAG